ncbi:type IX secretion system protein PorQ [Belliella marina]|uniref:Type IX secretion system protein PorQ n=1 Tax=Belliella marina TaxID=1644146 RepID=A0ABW4VUU3_9BACT
MRLKRLYTHLILLGYLLIPQQVTLGQTSHAAFNFVDNPSHAKLAALGGINITAGDDPLMFLSNPALLDSSRIQTPAFHYLNFPGGINVATLGYSFEGVGNGIVGLGIQYFNYGDFEGFDAIGTPTGQYSANEFAITAAYSKRQGVFQYGTNAKILGSVLEGYQAYALVFDLGINYYHPEMDLILAINVRNIGFNLNNYIEGQNLQLPSDFRIGASYKPEYAPIRFHLALRNLLGRETDFYLPSSFSGNETMGKADRMFRRAVFGVEILPSDQFHIRFGYNHLIRKEFETSDGPGAAGFSGGLAFRVKQFELSYARMFYNVPGGSNIFGISTAINKSRSF